MAKPNYAFAKHQRDVAKKKKKEEKRKLKEEAKLQTDVEGQELQTPEDEASDQTSDDQS